MSNTPQAVSSPLTGVGAGARILMGIVFIIAGLAKSFEPVVFYWEAISYVELLEVNRDAWPQIGRLALVLAPFEVLVGAALVLGWRPRWTFPAATGMMVFFVLITGLAWLKDADIDCGCFGTLAKRTPGEALAEDVLMLALLGVAWRWGTTRWSAVSWASAGRVALGVGGIALALLLFRFAPESERITSSDLKPGVRLTGIELSGAADIDLSRGAYLVELFSPRCGRCKSAVPKLNHWAETPGVPRLVALNEYPQDSPQLQDFIRQMRPRYPIASIASSDWMRLTWRHGWPRLAYVKDGVIQRVWEHNQMPTVAQLQKLGEG